MDTIRRTLLLTTLVGLVATLLAPAAIAGASHQTAVVDWHLQQAALGNEGVVEGATADLTRNRNGIRYQFRARDLTPGNAYTLWLIVVNNPDACEGETCTGPEVFESKTDSQVRFAAGHIVGESGRATFSGHVSEGPLDGWLEDGSLDDAMTAEVHLTLNDHGPALPEYLPNMIHTYRGGCSDNSPFPGIFPETALADGVEGPNICRLAQSAAFPAG